MGYILRLKLYTVDDNYINFLHQSEEKVMYNKSQKRPYVGIVFNINELNYFVPLTSPKAKHEIMGNDIDFRKIANGKYGAINFNKMIPVPDDCLVLIDVDAEKPPYQYVLWNQLKNVKKDKEIICNTAKKLYDVCMKPVDELTPHEQAVKERCCDFVRLEKLCKEYQVKFENN